MKTRILSIILAAVLVVSVCSVLAACGSDTAKTAKATTAASSPSSSAADNNNAAGNADNGAAQSGDNSGAAASSSADAETGDAPAATSAEYTGETVITSEQAISYVFDHCGYDDNYTAEYTGTIIIPDGSVWHGVSVFNAVGEIDGTYYVSDTTGDVKTTSELEAYAYR